MLFKLENLELQHPSTLIDKPRDVNIIGPASLETQVASDIYSVDRPA